MLDDRAENKTQYSVKSFYDKSHFDTVRNIYREAMCGVGVTVVTSPVLSLANSLYNAHRTTPHQARFSPSISSNNRHYPVAHRLKSSKLYQGIGGPIIEEVLFRGISLPIIYSLAGSVTQKIGIKSEAVPKVSSVLINASLFSLAHNRRMRLPTFFVGLIYDSLTLFNHGSIVASTVAHTSNNLISMTVGLPEFVKPEKVLKHILRKR